MRRKRGRPRKKYAKRRATTREGRRTGRDRADEGSLRLVQRKRRVGGGRVDLELNGASVLFGYELITQEQYDRLGEVTRWLQLVARAWGGADGSCASLWRSILAMLSKQRANLVGTPTGADAARFRLARALSRFNGSRDLVVELAEGRVPLLVLHVLAGEMTGRDRAQLERLRYGLDHML